ncbi:MAG: hypothetical protein K2Y32_07400 [Candidatus Obscuribacterales bacterium]|nr:hypothetical protein [Candidatus Obscuribacterales bacterium]
MAQDLLRLMKDLPYEEFRDRELADYVSGLFEARYRSEIVTKVLHCWCILENEGLIMQPPGSESATPYHVSLKGYQLKQCTDEDDRFIPQRHLSHVAEAIKRDLGELSDSEIDLRRQLQSEAEELMLKYAGKEAAELVRACMMGEADACEERLALNDVLYEIVNQNNGLDIREFDKDPGPVKLNALVKDVVKKWDGFEYRGSKVTEDSVLAWLFQFARQDRPYMLRLLQLVATFSAAKMRDEMSKLYRLIAGKLGKKDPQLLLCAFGSPAKSGSTCARMFKQEQPGRIDDAHISDIKEHLKNSGMQYDALVFVDDTIGSGANVETLVANLKEQELDAELKRRSISIYLCSVVALRDGLEVAQRACAKFACQAEVLSLYEFRKCFDAGIGIFQGDNDRLKAMSIANEFGLKLRQEDPLGFNDSQMVVVFHDNSPDNTLPVLNALPNQRSKTKSWIPLFPRI